VCAYVRARLCVSVCVVPLPQQKEMKKI
jgi:hypothetical protein